MTPEEEIPATELPRVDREWVDLVTSIVRRTVSEHRPIVNYQNGSGWKVAIALITLLGIISVGLSGWTLANVVALKVQFATLTQCVHDRESCNND